MLKFKLLKPRGVGGGGVSFPTDEKWLAHEIKMLKSNFVLVDLSFFRIISSVHLYAFTYFA